MGHFRLFAHLICLTFLVSCAHRDSNQPSKPITFTEFESVWLWRVDTPQRQIYIAGDWHDHQLTANEKLSHRLAYSAYGSSSFVLLESIGTKRFSDNPLKSRLKPSTWEALATAVRESMAEKLRTIKNLSAEQQAIPPDDFVEFVNRVPDSLLPYDVFSMLLPPPGAEREQLRMEPGFLRKISQESPNINPEKLGFLEMPSASYTAWSENCGQPSDLESLVREILTETDQNAQGSVRAVQEVIAEFRSYSGTSESMNRRMQNTSLWKTLNKCSVLPRNLEWMKTIKAQLGNDRQPLMVVAGISHVVGETGLLSLLCKEGYCQSQRIQEVK
jgi:TraB/PrgY/gumN family